MADSRLSAILDRSGDAATVAWAHDGAGDLTTLSDPELAIHAAGELGNVAALQAVVAPKSLRKAAALALHRIRSRGIKVADAVPPTAFTLAREAFDVPPRAFLSGPNAMGNCQLLMTATDREGSCIMEVIIGGDKVQDHHGHANRGELRRFWKEIEGDGVMVEIPFSAGLHLGDAALKGKPAHGWDHFLSKLAAGALAAARSADPRQVALADTGAEAEAWVLPAWLLPGAVVDGIVASLPADATPENEGWLNDAIAGALDGAGREAFAFAADRSALVFALLGRGAAAKSAWAAAARLRSGDDCRDLAPLRSAVLLAAFQDLQQRQTEQ
ncbi:MAG: hypothetical protein EXR71_08755 [Myxococcales bacterium]|nr:hypothetical protein [Myxococcales bacterium]